MSDKPSEKIELTCSLCNVIIETTHAEYIKRGHKCWNCNHGDLYITWAEYGEIAQDINRLLKALKKIPPSEAARIAQPLTDYLKPTGSPRTGAKGLG